MSILSDYEEIRNSIGEEKFNTVEQFLKTHPQYNLSDVYYKKSVWNGMEEWSIKHTQESAMTFEVNILMPNERNYTYSQSQQISMQTGCIGHLRADMDTDGEGFFSSWFDFRDDLKTQEFKDEFDAVVNELREKSNILCNRTALSKYCYSHSEASFGKDSLGHEREYGIRVNTDKYAYLMRLNPNKGEYNLYCYCYRRDWLDGHIEKVAEGIRFIDSNYKDLFRVNDGDKIVITFQDGEEKMETCRYIDQYHCEVGSHLYHICEFAERMEGIGATYRAVTPLLPEKSYGTLHTGDLIIIKYGERGYFNTDIPNEGKEAMKQLANEMNEKLGVTKAQAAAMLAGSMYGWSCPAANPKSYDENGTPIKSKQKDRGDAR